MLRINENVFFNRPYWIFNKDKIVEVSIPEGTKGKVLGYTDCFGEMTYNLELFNHETNKYVDGIFREVLNKDSK